MLFIFWIANLIFFWVAFAYFTKGHLTRHIGFFHFLLYFFAIYLASFSIYVSEGSVNNRYLISVMLYPVLLLCGMMLGSIFGAKTYFSNVELNTNRKDIRLIVTIVTLFLIVYIVYLYSLWPRIPLLTILKTGTPMEGHIDRYLATKGYTTTLAGLKILYWFPRILIDYFGVFVVVFLFYHLRKKVADYAKFTIILLVLILMGMMANEKYPAVKLFMATVLCAFNIKYETIRLRTLGLAIILLLASIIVGGLVYALVSGAYLKLANMGFKESLTYFINDLIWPLLKTRGMEGQSYPLYKIYELIPIQHDFFWGRTLMNPHGILPYKPVALPYFIYESYHTGVPQGLRGADPTVFYGEIYANFGFVISMISMVLFGFILQTVNSKLSDNIKKYRTPFDIAFFYLIMIYLGDFAIGFTVPYFDERLWFFLGIYFLRNTQLGFLKRGENV